MDKLQPVIKHRFWILAALVPPLCIFGYYKANGALKAATTERITTLDGVIGAIPSGTGANPTWTDGAKKLNEDYKKSVNVELVRVWDEQQARMTWPVSMQRYVPGTYRGQFPDEAGFTYKDEYPDLVAALHASVEPITPDSKGKGFSGKVWVEQKLIPRHVFGQLSVASDKIWDAQEDLWYLQLIFDAIRNVNRNAENAAKASIRKVYKVELRGGTGESSVKASGTGMSGDGAMAGMHGAMPSAEMSAEMYGGRNDQAGLSAPKVAFDPAEEFGPQTTQSTSTEGGPADAMHGAMPSGMSGGANRELIRYIKLDESAKFRERGFYLSVLIDQKKIPDFLVELSNADWPIRIVRFQVGPNPEKPGAMGNGMMDEYMSQAMPSGAPSAEQPFDAFDPAAYAEPGAMPADMAMGPSPLVTTEQMAGLFTHPDLVQLDVCGVITFYNPPSEELLAAVQAGTSGAEETGSADAGAPGAAVPAATEPAADATAAEPADSTEVQSDASAIPGAAPAAEPAVTEPGSGEAESTQPNGSAPPENAAPSEDTPATEPASEPGSETPPTSNPQ